ncbi:MAG TPA: YfiR family protein [Chthoniobacterales bacterium]|nr:YfiR family protein [Chthoniobacterales bacterium]
MRRLRLLITVAMVILPSLGFEAHAQESSVSSEYLIKAGFIYNFANLVQWPSNAFTQPDSPIVIGILGEDPFGTVLDRVLAGKKVNGRIFLVKRLKSVPDLKECHIVFVSSSEIAHLAEAIHLVKGMPILTIGEIPGFARRGGIINLFLEDNKVHFEVNVEAAKEADLNISSRLLALARIVQEPAADGKKTE